MNMDSPVVIRDVVAEYDKWHEQTGGGSDDPLRFPWDASLVEEFGSGLTGEVLEVGCGRGEFAHWLASTAPNVRLTGIDFRQQRSKSRTGEPRQLLRQSNFS